MITCWASTILLVMGALEQTQNRRDCPKEVKCNGRFAPKMSTTFGLYVAGVCGTNLTEWDIKFGLKPTEPQVPRRMSIFFT